jgi:hypothetical protein
MSERPSRVEGCHVTGGQEGIVTHLAPIAVVANRVDGTTMRGIAVTEMSMGKVRKNVVRNARGVGIYCGDYSHCDIRGNRLHGIRPDGTGIRTRLGFGIVSDFYAGADVKGNRFTGGTRGAAAFANGWLRQR